MIVRRHVIPARPAGERPVARPRRRNQRGAALVEMALVALLLCTLSAGAFDYGMAWRAALATNEAARTAARTGSALGPNPQADWYALSGARAALKNSKQLNNVTKVVIFKSATADGAPPAECLTATSSSQPCTMINGSQFQGMTASSFHATTGCFTVASIKNWCPSSRNNVQLSADYYGIWIQVRYGHTFRILTSQTLIARDAVMRLEPTVS